MRRKLSEEWTPFSFFGKAIAITTRTRYMLQFEVRAIVRIVRTCAFLMYNPNPRGQPIVTWVPAKRLY